MKRILILILLLSATAFATRKGVVIMEDTTIVSAKDQILLTTLTNMGYSVKRLDIDNIAATAASYYDTLDFVISTGCEDSSSAPSPSANIANACNSYANILSFNPNNYDELNMGSAGTCASPNYTQENGGYILNVARDHNITKVMQDTIDLLSGDNNTYFIIQYPDSFNTKSRALLIDKDRRLDTNNVILAVADSGTVLANNVTAKGIRSFCALLSPTYTMDSCHLWTLITRTIAYVAQDTANDWANKNVCFSGKYETKTNGVMENSSGTDSLEIYGGWGSLYTGFDYDMKHFYLGVEEDAMIRKIINIYRSIDVDTSSYMRLYRIGYDIHPNDTANLRTYQMSTQMRMIKQWWRERRPLSNTSVPIWSLDVYPFACWTYRYDAVTWNTGGAQGVGTDQYNLPCDSVVVNRTDGTYSPEDTVGTYVHVHMTPADSFDVWLLDTTRWHGVVPTTTYHSWTTGGGVEDRFYSPRGGNRRQAARFQFKFNSWSFDEPQPSIVIQEDSIVVTATTGGADPEAGVNVVLNGSSGSMECATITEGAAWLTLDLSSGINAPITIRHTISITGLTAGYYSATVSVGCADADNTPQTYKVALTVSDPVTTTRPTGGAVKVE